MKTGLQRLALLLFLFIAATFVFVLFDLDLAIEKMFFSPTDGWHYRNSQPWAFLYEYGTIPGLILTLIALLGCVISAITPWWRQYRRHMLLIFLTSVLGAGILVNGILKPYWGRPRPRQIQMFSGHWDFHHPHQTGTPGKGQSFPCGHCTMGFLFVTLFFFRDRSRTLAIAGGSFGIVYGTVVGIGRMAQGAHFPTDVIWSFGIILLVSTLLHYFVLPKMKTISDTAKDLTAGQKVWWTVSAAVLVVGVALAFLTHRPFYDTFTRQVKLSPKIDTLVIETYIDFEGTNIIYEDNRVGRFVLYSQGFGWMNASHRVGLNKIKKGKTVKMIVRAESKGYFSELNHGLTLSLPIVFREKLKIHIKNMT
jgi:lipid A 4'-phosphatase